MQIMMRKPKPMPLRGRFMLKPAAALTFAAYGDWLIWERHEHAGALGLLALALLGAIVFARQAVLRDWRGLACLALATLAAGSIIYDPSWLGYLLFAAFALLAALFPGIASAGDGWKLFQRVVYAMTRLMARPAADLARWRKAKKRRLRRKVDLRYLLSIIVLPLLGSLVIIALFAMANPVIEQLLGRVGWPQLPPFAPTRMVLWLCLMMIVWLGLRPCMPRKLRNTFDGRGDLELPGVSPASVFLSLIMFNLLFAVQNTMDFAWLWGLMAMPQGMTLAQYAHRGAYPLIVTALLAAGFVLVALRPGSRTAEHPLIRWLVVLWLAQNVLLVVSSVVRTLDYIEAYSLTGLRIAALLWMGLVALGLILTGWRLLREKSGAWLINANLIAATILLYGTLFVDFGEVSANWNVRHSRETTGYGASLDMSYLQSLGPSALPALLHLEQTSPAGPMQNLARQLRLDAHAKLKVELATGGWSKLGEMRLTMVTQNDDVAPGIQPSWRQQDHEREGI